MSSCKHDLATRYRGFHSPNGPQVIRKDVTGTANTLGDAFEWGIDSDGENWGENRCQFGENWGGEIGVSSISESKLVLVS